MSLCLRKVECLRSDFTRQHMFPLCGWVILHIQNLLHKHSLFLQHRNHAQTNLFTTCMYYERAPTDTLYYVGRVQEFLVADPPCTYYGFRLYFGMWVLTFETCVSFVSAHSIMEHLTMFIILRKDLVKVRWQSLPSQRDDHVDYAIASLWSKLLIRSPSLDFRLSIGRQEGITVTNVSPDH
jgi:hypothetical protein